MKPKTLTLKQQQRLAILEKRERYFLKKLMDIIRDKHPQYEYDVHLSNIGSGCAYDAFILIKEGNKTVKKYFVEVKVREFAYNDDQYLLELSKLNSLNKEVKFHKDFDILYINFTPNKTYIWPITELIEQNNLGKLQAQKVNNYTFLQDGKKRNKRGYYLDTNLSITIDYTYNQQDFEQYLTVKEFKNVIPKNENKTYTVSLF